MSKHRTPWTTDEETLLLCEVLNRCDDNYIAKNHERTVDGIKYRKIKIALDLVKDKQKKEDICDIFQMTMDQLKEHIRDMRKYKRIYLND